MTIIIGDGRLSTAVISGAAIIKDDHAHLFHNSHTANNMLRMREV